MDVATMKKDLENQIGNINKDLKNIYLPHEAVLILLGKRTAFKIALELIDSLQQEQKPAEWNEEDELTIADLINYFEGDSLECSAEEMVQRIKSLRPQPKIEWSEEDNDKLEQCIRIVSSWEGDYDIVKSPYSNFLKSLRPQPQDTYQQVVRTIFNMLKDKDFYDIQPSNRVSLLNDIRVKCKDAIECAPILDALHWKPSEEQMEALERTIHLSNFGLEEDRRKALVSLYEQLKAL